MKRVPRGWSATVPGARGACASPRARPRRLYEQLGAARRSPAPPEIGEALVALYAGDPEPHLAEIAHHFFEAAPGGDRDKAIAWDARAATSDRGCSPTRKRPVCTAWRSPRSTESRDEPARCELLLALGDAQARSGEMVIAKGDVRGGRGARAATWGSSDRLARAAIGYGGRFVWVRSGKDHSSSPCSRTRWPPSPSEDSVLRIKLLARLAGALRDRSLPER